MKDDWDYIGRLEDALNRVLEVVNDRSLQTDEGILIIAPSRVTDILDEVLGDSDG